MSTITTTHTALTIQYLLGASNTLSEINNTTVLHNHYDITFKLPCLLSYHKFPSKKELIFIYIWVST